MKSNVKGFYAKIFLRQRLLSILLGILMLIDGAVFSLIVDGDLFRFYALPKNIDKLKNYELSSYSVGEKEYYYAEDTVKMDINCAIDCVASDSNGQFILIPFNENKYLTLYVKNEY